MRQNSPKSMINGFESKKCVGVVSEGTIYIISKSQINPGKVIRIGKNFS